MEKKVCYEMFSPAGERACQSLVGSITKKVLGAKRITKEQLKELYDNGLEKVSQKHDEVYDTEPRWKIAREINEALVEAGYGFKLNSWGDIEE